MVCTRFSWVSLVPTLNLVQRWRAALAGLTCPAGGVLEKVGKIVARREAGADGLPPLEVAREPGVSRRAGLKEVAWLHWGRCARSHPARRRAGRWRTRGPCAGAP